MVDFTIYVVYRGISKTLPLEILAVAYYGVRAYNNVQQSDFAWQHVRAKQDMFEVEMYTIF